MTDQEKQARIKAAAERALAEAERRRAGGETDGRLAPSEEIGGVEGPEPTRYGDWEKAGRAYDF